VRILHVTDDLQRAGAERNLISIIRHLPQHEHRVVYFLEEAAYRELLEGAGVRVERVPISAPRDWLRAVVRLREMMKETDVVHTQRWMADLVARVAAFGRKPLVTTVQTSPYEPATLRSYRPRARIAAHILWAGDAVLSRFAADRVIAVSEAVRDIAIRRLRVPSAQTAVVYNAIDTGEFHPPTADERNAARAALGLAERDVAIVSAGHLIPNKGQSLLIEALPRVVRHHPETRLLLAGAGWQQPDLEALATKLGVADNVRFLGLRSDMPRVLVAADIYVLASFLEGLPLSVVEAMATGLACALSPIPPHQELGRLVAREAQLEDAMLATAQTAEAWSETLQRLVGSPDLRRRLGELGRHAALRHFDARRSASSFEAVLRSVVEK
jgi:glycosyltransferase involved in cell wall biosynthesis